jgi:hypothetical protein
VGLYKNFTGISIRAFRDVSHIWGVGARVSAFLLGRGVCFCLPILIPVPCFVRWGAILVKRKVFVRNSIIRDATHRAHGGGWGVGGVMVYREL